MAKGKGKYRVNLHSLELELVTPKLRDRLKRVLLTLLGGAVFATIILLIAYSYFDSPKERMMKREIDQYEVQLDLMNDRMNQLSTVLEDLEQRDNTLYRTIFEAEPISREERMAGIGGSSRYADLQGFANSKRITETTARLDRLSRQLYVQSKSYDEIRELAKSKTKMMLCIPAIQPVTNKNAENIASGFGMRRHPIYKTWRIHTGIDFTGKIGTPVYATGDGKVIQPGDGMSGYGNVVMIDHGFGFKTLYAHLSKSIVKPGQVVKRGEIIGYLGNSGMSTGPHLHYEVWKAGTQVNPVHYFFQDLTPEEYQKVIEIASRPNQSLS